MSVWSTRVETGYKAQSHDSQALSEFNEIQMIKSLKQLENYRDRSIKEKEEHTSDQLKRGQQHRSRAERGRNLEERVNLQMENEETKKKRTLPEEAKRSVSHGGKRERERTLGDGLVSCETDKSERWMMMMMMKWIHI